MVEAPRPDRRSRRGTDRGNLSAVPLGLALAGPLAELTSARAVLTGAAACAVAGTLAVLAVREVR